MSLTDGNAGEVDSILAQPKRFALLAYLALARPRGFHRRSTLLALFWPEQDEQHARWSLNQALRYLRDGLGRATIISRGGDEVGLDTEAVWSDAVAFEAACDASQPEAALNLYRGDLLEGLYVSGCVELERWADGERARFRRLAARAAWVRADQLLAVANTEAAVDVARRAVSLSDQDETGVRRLIELLDRLGDRAGAVREYEDHAEQLRELLDVEPAPETQALIAAVKSRRPTHREFPVPVSVSAANGVPPVGPKPDSIEAARDSSSEPGHDGPTRRRITGSTMYVIATAASVLIVAGFTSLYTMVGRDGPSTGTIDLTARSAAPGVAVLPFHVTGSGQEVLSEGMVDLLFADLDGVSGIRPISPLTVLTRWNERAPADAHVDLETALEVARSSGAQYAVVGSAVAIGPRVRLAASIYEVSETEPLGQASETTHRDSIWSAVDRVAMEVVRAVGAAGQGELAGIDLRGLTTESPEALKAYLRAEAHYRRADMEASAAAYERAIEEDSAFAQAHLGLAWSLAWDPLVSTPKVAERPRHLRAALEHPLTDRQELIARASLALMLEHMSIDMIDELQRAVAAHADDPHLWYLLAEHYMHVATATGSIDDHGERAQWALENAVELAPDFVPYWLHLVDLAFIHGDSVRTWDLIARVTRLLDPGSRTALELRSLFEVAFGGSPGDAAFQSSLDTLEEIGGLRRAYSEILARPEQWPAAEAALERFRKLRPEAKDCLWRQRALAPGSYRTFLADAIVEPVLDRCFLLLAMFDLPVPEPLVDSLMTARLQSAVEGDATAGRSLALPVYFADRGRWAEHDSVLAIWRANAAAARASGDARAARRWPYRLTALEGYAEWKRGRPARALEILESLPVEARAIYDEIRWWLGSLYLELNRPAEAVGQFRTFQGVYNTPNWTLAYLRLGQAYEKLGDVEAARAQYSYVVDAWEDADPELQPWVDLAWTRLNALREAPASR